MTNTDVTRLTNNRFTNRLLHVIVVFSPIVSCSNVLYSNA